MKWRDDAIIITVRRHGETSAIIDLFSKSHGRYAGLVRGGMSRRLRPVLQSGNLVDASWHARLEEHLGNLTIEPKHGFASHAMSVPESLCAVLGLCSLLKIVPERQAHARLYELSCLILENITEEDMWPILFARFEMALLEDMGFGLDLKSCAATGARENLHYVSPRSGRAVSAAAAKPYLDKLFILPIFLSDPQAINVPLCDVVESLKLTGYFLERRLYHPHNLTLPEARQAMIDKLQAKVPAL